MASKKTDKKQPKIMDYKEHERKKKIRDSVLAFSARAADLIQELKSQTIQPIARPIQAPDLHPALLGALKKQNIAPPVLAADNYAYCPTFPTPEMYGYGGDGFPGYSYLSSLTLRAEYRQFAEVNATELTRAWIKLTCNDVADENTKQKISIIEQRLTELNVQNVISRCAEHVDFYGSGHIFIEIEGADRNKPLILSPKTIKRKSLLAVKTVEPIWVTPAMYNAVDPGAKDFYRPYLWFMMGYEVHASRLLNIVTREVADLFKPAYNFSGISLSQLAEPYVNNWLRTRQSVADLINNFSILSLSTDMTAILQGAQGAEVGLLARAALFTQTRSNKGLMLLDKDMEELNQLAVPLGGLHELQSQAQEHLCTVSGIPAVKLLGVSPAGFNATADGEIRAFYDKKSAEQNRHWRKPIDLIIKLIMLSEFGEIDESIGFDFNPLWQMDANEREQIKLTKAQTSQVYITDGVLSPMEVRETLARDPESDYNGLDISDDLGDPDSLSEQQENEQEPYEEGEQYTETAREREQTIR